MGASLIFQTHHNLQKRYRVRPSLRRRRMILQANFVLNNPALLLKYYDFNPAILVGLYLARNSLSSKFLYIPLI